MANGKQAQTYERKVGKDGIRHWQARQNLPLDFSYGGAAHELMTVVQ